jgi:O-antigen/teichoic acid export membrane protein
MNAAGKAIWIHGLKRRALSLGAVKAFDHAMQFLLPIILVRCLDSATFGEYRLLWLAVGTVMALAQLNMGGGLYYFLPRSNAAHKRLYIHQTVLYLAGAGLVCAWLVSPLNPLLPEPAQPLQQYGALVPAFIGLWLVGSLLDYLPTVEERIDLQAYATVTVSALRVLLVGLGAWFSGDDLRLIVCLLLVVVLVKLAMLFAYMRRRHGLGRPWFDRKLFAGQVRYSAPFGISTALFSLRSQSDQWVAASLFALSSFAAFSIAALVGQVVYIFRQSVMEVFLPSMSRMEAAGDVRGMMEMNRRANVMVGTLLYPLLALGFVFAEEIIAIVYTEAYLEAAAVVRVYVVGMLAMVIEMGSVVLLLRQGAFALKVTALALGISVAVSLVAANFIGLAGAAAGSVLTLYLDRAIMLRRVSRHTGIPLRSVQDWRALGWALGSAALSAALAYAAVERFLDASAPLVRLAAGTAVLALAYAACSYPRTRKQ